jgi:hypothetical protein
MNGSSDWSNPSLHNSDKYGGEGDGGGGDV